VALEWPLTAAQVRTWLDVTDDTTDDSLDQAVEAVVDYVPTIPGLSSYWTDAEPPVFAPDATVILGAAMLANRWHERRGSALGSTGYTEFGTGTILRHDPDIARMLRLASFAPFGFGAPSLPVEEEEA
jgi:hypothetical protein